MKKAAQFLLMLAVAICICIAAPEVYAAEGTCGTNVLWTLDEDTGAMTISGSGAITSYTGWKSYRAQIKTLTVDWQTASQASATMPFTTATGSGICSCPRSANWMQAPFTAVPL